MVIGKLAANCQLNTVNYKRRNKIGRNPNLNMNFIRLFLFLLIFTFITNLQAQQRKCGSVEHTQELMKNPEYQQDFRKRMAAFNRLQSKDFPIKAGL